MALDILDLGNSREFPGVFASSPLADYHRSLQSGTLAMVALIIMRETYEAVILIRKAASLR